MSDSLKALLKVQSLSKTARARVPFYRADVSDHHRRKVGRPYPKRVPETSPMTGTGMPFLTFWADVGGEQVASELVVDMNIPNALVGHNFVHGTSVYAAGMATLALLKLCLKGHGVPTADLDRLTPDQVSLQGVTVTYLLEFGTEGELAKFVSAAEFTAKTFRIATKTVDSSNLTITVPLRGASTTMYGKTDFSHCAVEDPAVVRSLKAVAARTARIEVYLQGHLLRDRNWDTIASWKEAYSQGRYEAIFNEFVRGPFRCADLLRTKKPRAEALVPLTPGQASALAAYFNGDALDAIPQIADGETAMARSKRKSKLKRALLKKTRIDIGIPWREHQKLDSVYLARTLTYPGDYHPAEDLASHCFCRASWPEWRRKLEAALQ